MVENVSVNKAIVSVCEGGINHKSVVVRAQVAMLIDHVITAIGTVGPNYQKFLELSLFKKFEQVRISKEF